MWSGTESRGSPFSRSVLVRARGGALAAARTRPPSRELSVPPIRLVVPFAAGSATDTIARLLAQELAQRLGQNVLVDNRPGANGQIAAVFVAKSAPDGYTLFMTTNTTHSANPHLYKTLPYDPVNDFEPVVRNGDAAVHARRHPGPAGQVDGATARLRPV